MTENNENSMYFLFENPVIIGERLWCHCEQGQRARQDSPEPDVSRALIKNREPADETLRLTPVILCMIIM